MATVHRRHELGSSLQPTQHSFLLCSMGLSTWSDLQGNITTNQENTSIPCHTPVIIASHYEKWFIEGYMVTDFRKVISSQIYWLPYRWVLSPRLTRTASPVEFIFLCEVQIRKKFIRYNKTIPTVITQYLFIMIITWQNTCIPWFINVEHNEMSMLQVLKAKERTATSS